MAQQLIALAALAEDSGVGLSTHMGQLTCNFTSRVSDVQSGLCTHLHTQAHTGIIYIIYQ